MSYLQILILMISSFAFAYLIYSATEVSAQAENILENYACCEKTINGIYCQFVPEDQCDSSFGSAPTQCEEVDYCKLGCCFSQNTGWCNENTPERSCRENRGLWTDDTACNIAECQRGCCILGRNAIFTTNTNCNIKSGFLGLTPDFRADIRTELECIFLTEREDEGACVYEEDYEKTCRFTTRESCDDGEFYKDLFCSDSRLGTDCTAHERKSCLDGEESVYWFDSCGNREEVAEECSIFTGTICGQVEGEHECKSIDCEVDGKIRKNGESWCEYDGTIGGGRDAVGSRHIKHICFMGEERIEPCEDYRNQICVQSDVDIGDGETFSEAACRINNWRSCLGYNTEDEAKEKTNLAEKCQENPDCTIKGVHIDKFSFDVCAPKYPPGFDLTDESGGENAEAVCSMASQKCTVIYVKHIDGWKCEVNCDCEKAGFAQQMNELCTSLGDCGAYVNIVGDVTDDGYSVSRSPRLSQSYLNNLKQYAIPKPGQKPAEPGNLSFLGSLGASAETSYDGGGSKTLTYVGLGIAGIQLIPGVLGALAEAPGIGDVGFALGNSVGNIWASNPSVAFGNGLMAAGAVLSVQNLLSAGFGMKDSTAWIAAGVAVVFALKIMNIGFKTLGMIGLIITIAMLVLGIGKSKKKVVTFNCLPWQAPTGGEDCNKCNGAEKPCSPYRCKSLGQTCELINQGTEDEICFDNSPIDISSPKISPLLGMITEGYRYIDSGNNFARGFEVTDLDENCIPEFTNVLFGIKTDKPAQCRIGSSALQTYDEMEDFFGGSNLYLTNHTSTLNLPSPESLRNQYNLTEAQIKELEEINLYVKCKSVIGAVNEAAYTIKTCAKPGPDLTPPYIARTEPDNGAYIKYNATEQFLKLWTNEPANCKWSVERKDYVAMENSMTCETDLEDYGLYGWGCNTTLDVSENTDFYIRCRDLSDNNNTMEPSAYELVKSESELKIDEIKPTSGEEIIAGTEPMTLTLEAKTSGGAESGKADCSFRFGETGNYIRFLNTFSSLHSQVFTQITSRSYKVYVKCEDVAGNRAENFTEFNVEIDTSAPIIARAYYDEDLTVVTNEDSRCGYSFTDTRCRFDIENSTLMSGTKKTHSADWQTDSTYYIKCEDTYGNKPGGCSIIARAYDML